MQVNARTTLGRGHRMLAAAAIAATLVACSARTPEVDPQFVGEWMRNYYGLVRAERISPPVAARVLGYASVALYEGLAAPVEGRSLAGRLNGLDSLPRPANRRRVDPVLVALAAQRTVLDSLLAEGIPATRAALATLTDSMDAARVALGISSGVQSASREFGETLGRAILAWADRDGFAATRTKPFKPVIGDPYWINDSRFDEYTPQNLSATNDFVAFDNPAAAMKAGAVSERSLAVTRPKPADLKVLKAVNPAGATEPWFGTLRPFVLKTADECPTPAPAAWSTARGSPHWLEAKRVYDVGKALTPEQYKTALYWADNGGQTGTPVGHWLAIGSQLVSQQKLSADKAAELFVQMTLAQTDAFIAVWYEKFRLNTIRPVTYIRRYIDPKWTPAIVTPPFPEFPSGHSGQSAAAATVLTALLGTVAFDDSSNLALGHQPRRYASFKEAADEAAMSRLYGGIHFPMGNEHGKTLGRCVGEKIVERLGTSTGAK